MVFLILSLSSYASFKLYAWKHSKEIPADTAHDTKQTKIEQILKSQGDGTLTQHETLARRIMTLSRLHHIDPLLVLSVIKVESSFRPQVISNAGAIGLMQVKPVVVKELQKPVAGSIARSLKDPTFNVEVGVAYLSYLRKHFGMNNWSHVLAAYNMGPTFVKRRLKRRKSLSRKYYTKVMNAYRKLQEDT